METIDAGARVEEVSANVRTIVSVAGGPIRCAGNALSDLFDPPVGARILAGSEGYFGGSSFADPVSSADRLPGYSPAGNDPRKRALTA